MFEALVIRHAETDWNRDSKWQGAGTDRPLSPAGLASVDTVRGTIAESFARRPQVFSSSLVRAIQTAIGIFGEGPIDIDNRLIEIGGGPIEGLTREEVSKRLPSFLERWDQGAFVCPPGGERTEQVIARVVSFLDQQSGASVPWCAVCHLGTIRAMSHVLGLRSYNVANLSGIALSGGVWIAWNSQDRIRYRPPPHKTLAVGYDTVGLALRNAVRDWAESRGIEICELGAQLDRPADDYASVAVEVSQMVASGSASRGVLICGTGIGMSIAANKVRGIRAATPRSGYEARRSVESNDAQILCLGSEVLGPGVAREILDTWYTSAFRDGNSTPKVAMLRKIDEE